MAEFVDPILRFIADHRAWAYALAYLLAMAEALPLVGTVVPGSIIIAYIQHRPRRLGGKALAAVAFGAFLVAGVAHIDAKFQDDARRYAVRASPVVISLEAWREGRWRELPARRADMEGEFEEPLTIQWAGDLDRLMDTLLGSGWQTPAPWSARSALTWLSPQAGGDTLPVLPKLHDGRFPTLTLVRVREGLPSGVFRLVVRLWDSGVRLTALSGPSRVLWVGETVAESMSRPIGLFSIVRTMSEFDAPLGAFRDSLAPGSFIMRSRETTMAGWEGQVILGSWIRTPGKRGLAIPLDRASMP